MTTPAPQATTALPATTTPPPQPAATTPPPRCVGEANLTAFSTQSPDGAGGVALTCSSGSIGLNNYAAGLSLYWQIGRAGPTALWFADWSVLETDSDYLSVTTQTEVPPRTPSSPLFRVCLPPPSPLCARPMCLTTLFDRAVLLDHGLRLLPLCAVFDA